MSDDEYYFEDDYGDGECDGEVESSEVETLYVDAKMMVEQGADAAKCAYQKVIEADTERGKWTFKSLKGIYRAATRHRNVGMMLEFYQKTLDFSYTDQSRVDVEKHINKFLDRTSHLPVEVLKTIFAATLRACERDLKSLDKMWFNVKLKTANVAFSESRFDDVANSLEQLREWCGQGASAETRKATQRILVFALEMQMASQLSDTVKLQKLYEAAMSIKSAIPPPRALGVIQECGGKMYMRRGQWSRAHEAFLEAFRAFDEAGDSRRIACLKYLVLSTMLRGSKINPFDSVEAKSFQNDPEIVEMTELIKASENNDIRRFNDVLEKTKTMKEDSFLFSYIAPLQQNVRRKIIPVLAKPYRQMKLQYLADELGVDECEAENLCLALILDGALRASIDQEAGVLVLSSDSRPLDPGVADRSQSLVAIAEWQRGFLSSVTSRCVAVANANAF